MDWWRTPPESPDSNPIENLWHELKVCSLAVYIKKMCNVLCTPRKLPAESHYCNDLLASYTTATLLYIFTYILFILQEFIRREVKPRTKDELVHGIERCWETVTVQKCRKYIGHLRKVLPRIVELDGAASGY